MTAPQDKVLTGTMQRASDAMDKAMQSAAMVRILMDVTEPVVTQKIVDAFIEGAKCGAEAMGAEMMAKIKGARCDD